MPANYDQWNAVGGDDSPKAAAAAAPKEHFSVSDPLEARRRAEQAKAGGSAPNPLDDLFTLGPNASAKDLMEKLKNLPAGAKQQVLEGLQSPAGKQALDMAFHAKKEAAQAPKPATGQSEDGGAALVGHRVVLDGIQARPELNGRKGVVLQYMSAKGRCAVRLDGEAEGSAPLSLKPVCLTRAE